MPEFQLSSKPRIKCRCGKIRAMSEKDARGMRKFIATKKGHENPVRYYQCGYGGWHWTRMLKVNAPLPDKVFRECGDPKCTNVFEANPVNADHTYCSRACSKRGQKQRRREREAREEAARRDCVQCGGPYTPTQDDQRYCGKDCRQQGEMAKFAKRHPITPLSIKKMHDCQIQ